MLKLEIEVMISLIEKLDALCIKDDDERNSSMVTFTEQGGLKSILWFWSFLSLMLVKTRYALTKLSSGIWRIIK